MSRERDQVGFGAAQARQAVYFDFEGTKVDVPSLVGVLSPEGDPGRDFVQFVFEPQLWPAAEAHSRGQRRGGACQIARIEEVLEVLRRKAAEGKRLVAWSSRELDVVREASVSFAAKDEIVSAYVDAKVIGKRWKRRFHPEVVFPRDPRRGAHHLERYLRLIGYSVPPIHRSGNTGSRIKYVRSQLEKHGGVYADISTGGKRKWANLLAHNRHDCEGLRVLTLRMLEDIEN